MANIYDTLPKPFYVLAPMDDVTDSVFRQIVAASAPPDLFFTEFVNVDGLQSPGREALLPKLRFTEAEKPLVAQLWGKVPANYYKTAQELADQGYSGIDINMGCPDKTIVKNGCCAAFITNRDLASEVIQAVQEGAAGKIPVSVKTRLGFNEVDLSWHEFLLGHKLAALTVHGRTRKEMSLVPARWDLIGEVRARRDKLAPDTKIIGNGDVAGLIQGQSLYEQYGVDGIMIGRGIFQDPFAFTLPSPWSGYSPRQKLALYRRHIDLFAHTWQNHERKLHSLNKFCKTYVNGFGGAKELRDRLMRAGSLDELSRILDHFTAQLPDELSDKRAL